MFTNLFLQCKKGISILGHCIKCTSSLFSGQVTLIFVCVCLLGLKVAPKSHTPFDSRMAQKSPMTITYDHAQKKFFACGGLSSKDNNAHMHKLYL
jgi:hypothetical protein